MGDAFSDSSYCPKCGRKTGAYIGAYGEYCGEKCFKAAGGTVVENDKQWEALEREEDNTRFFNSSENLLAKAKADREAAEKSMAILIDRKQKAEADIAKAVKQRLLRAKRLGKEKAREVQLTHFIMGGLDVSVEEVGGLRIVSSFKLGRTGVLVNGYLIAVRLEENPGYPTFLLAESSVASEDERSAVDALEKLLKTYMKSYARISDLTLQEIWKK